MRRCRSRSSTSFESSAGPSSGMSPDCAPLSSRRPHGRGSARPRPMPSPSGCTAFALRVTPESAVICATRCREWRGARLFFCPAGKKRAWQRPTLPPHYKAVPSALEGLTSVFGMGTGGTPPLWSPGKYPYVFVDPLPHGGEARKKEREHDSSRQGRMLSGFRRHLRRTSARSLRCLATNEVGLSALRPAGCSACRPPRTKCLEISR